MDNTFINRSGVPNYKSTSYGDAKTSTIPHFDRRQKRKSSEDVEIDNSQHILKKIATLYAEKLMNDICLVVGNVEYPAHRLILCTSSEVFHVMLMKPQWSESQESRIVLQETPQCAAIFPEFLRYFYTGQIRINQSTIMGILTLADKYNVKDLISLCIGYMYKHISEAAVNNQIITWYQYTLSLAHYQLSQEKRQRDTEVWKDKPNMLHKPITNQWEALRRACRNFIKWNFELVASSSDFGNFHPDVLTMLLQQNDLVVQNEMVLYDYIVAWLDVQLKRIREELTNESDVDSQHFALVSEVMVNIRFPMMDSRQLASLLLSPLVMKYKEFFMERMAIGVAFHQGQETDQIKELQTQENWRLHFTPRLYTAEQWSSNMLINNFSKLPPYHPSTLVCSSPPALRESLYEQACEWIIDLYPKGIWFQQCYLIVWQGTVVVPEVVMRTVRMSIRCRDPPPRDDLTVKIGVLVSGVTCNIEHVVEVAYYVHKFSASDTTFNINDLLSYSKLNDRFNLLPRVDEPVSAFKPVSGNTSDMPYLIGAERNTLKLQIVIIPLCPKLSLIDEPYNSTFCSVMY